MSGTALDTCYGCGLPIAAAEERVWLGDNELYHVRCYEARKGQVSTKPLPLPEGPKLETTSGEMDYLRQKCAAPKFRTSVDAETVARLLRDIDALLAENRRLNEECQASMATIAEERSRVDTARAEGRKAERKKIVAWLRAADNKRRDEKPVLAMTAASFANAIERAAHHPEAK